MRANKRTLGGYERESSRYFLSLSGESRTKSPERNLRTGDGDGAKPREICPRARRCLALGVSAARRVHGPASNFVARAEAAWLARGSPLGLAPFGSRRDEEERDGITRPGPANSSSLTNKMASRTGGGSPRIVCRNPIQESSE